MALPRVETWVALVRPGVDRYELGAACDDGGHARGCGSAYHNKLTSQAVGL
ncbi:hypothetical protein [Kaarinaea lacus]